MKYEVIGWTSYDDPDYATFEEKSPEEYLAARLAVIEDVRQKGYSFGGDSHQNVAFCTPVLNDGRKFCCSMREWGALMAEALREPKDDISYMIWYMDIEIEYDDNDDRRVVYPTEGVDRSKIAPKGTTFEIVIPTGYEPYTCSPDPQKVLDFVERFVEEENIRLMPSEEGAEHPIVMEMKLNDEAFKQVYSGKKTVEVRLNDKKRQQLSVGDIIQFLHKDDPSRHMRTEVVGLYPFPGFYELFSSELFDKTGFSDCTPEEATERMYAYYKKSDEEAFGALAIEIKVLTK